MLNQGLPLFVSFGANGSFKSYEHEGFYPGADHESYSWSAGIAKIEVYLERIDIDPNILIEVISSVVLDPNSEIILFVNGKFVHSWKLIGGDIKTAKVEKDFFLTGKNSVTFYCPQARSLKIRGLGEDERELGAAIKNFSIIE